MGIITNLLILLTYFGIGMICRRTHTITENGISSFSRFTLNIALPCTVFQSFMLDLTKDNYEIALILLLVSAGTCLLSFGIGILLFHKIPGAQQCVMRYSVLISNCTFIGMPLMSSIYGPMGVFYTSVFVIPNRFFMWSAGVWLFSGGRSDWREIFRRVLLNPCMIACYLGTAWLLFQLPLPFAAANILGNISACTAPLSMITIGAILARIGFRDIFCKNVWMISLCRLILLPILVWGFLGLAGAPHLVVLVSVLMTGMPLANTVILLAEQYGGDVDLAGKATLLSVLLSVITIPLFALFV